MKLVCLFLTLSILSGCNPRDNCPMHIGYKVREFASSRIGVVVAVDGEFTGGCTIVVRHEDNTYSNSGRGRGDGHYSPSPHYVHYWNYERVR